MKLLTILTFSLVISNVGSSQDLIGKWKWQNENFSGDVYFTNSAYFIKVYFKNSDSKVSESFSYIKQRGDTLVFSQIGFDVNPKDLKYYLINNLSYDKLELLDVSNGEVDIYTNVDHGQYKLSKIHADEFYFSGGIGCVSSENRQDYNNCLNFKSISILSSLKEIEQILGKPYSTVNQGDINYTIYLLPSDLKSPPYLAVSVNDRNELNTIQISGAKSSDEFAFSGIRLGDYYTMVENRLGKPTGVKRLDEDTELWTYDPHRISIEIKNKNVFSIKLRRL